MRTIWKFPLEVTDNQVIDMPAGAMTLTVMTQHGKPYLWAQVDPSAKKMGRLIITHGTGHNVPETTGDYIGSYQLNNGNLVFHVFESAPDVPK